MNGLSVAYVVVYVLSGVVLAFLGGWCIEQRQYAKAAALLWVAAYGLEFVMSTAFGVIASR